MFNSRQTRRPFPNWHEGIDQERKIQNYKARNAERNLVSVLENDESRGLIESGLMLPVAGEISQRREQRRYQTAVCISELAKSRDQDHALGKEATPTPTPTSWSPPHRRFCSPYPARRVLATVCTVPLSQLCAPHPSAPAPPPPHGQPDGPRILVRATRLIVDGDSSRVAQSLTDLAPVNVVAAVVAVVVVVVVVFVPPPSPSSSSSSLAVAVVVVAVVVLVVLCSSLLKRDVWPVSSFIHTDRSR
ncbi:hypothetical protein K0M31_012332 [Melipona bicolor]|uniref:Uncharacterized protein n=1 Tax=Melipona bicolor TaxID=60889 RepID=A0AA40FJM9_9HYME|nr:hypothetical protein K0M31_012332 [Melipona bicolor]